MRASAAPCPRLPPVMRTVLLLNFCCTALALSCWTRWGQANRESAGSEALTPRGSVHGPIRRRQKPARFNSLADSSLKGNTISPHWKGWCDGRRLHTTDGCGAGEDRKSVRVGKECRSRWSPYH